MSESPLVVFRLSLPFAYSKDIRTIHIPYFGLLPRVWIRQAVAVLRPAQYVHRQYRYMWKNCMFERSGLVGVNALYWQLAISSFPHLNQ